jgi:hypothetical protein
VSARHAVLSIGTVLVLGLGVYLLVAVRADPAAEPPRAAERAAPPTRPAASPPSDPATPARAPTAPPAGAPAAAGARAPAWIPSHPGAPLPAPAVASADAATAGSDDLGGPKLELVMDEANKAYDRGDYDDAKAVAARVLARQPSNARMLRIMVSASCIDGDSATAMTSYARLSAADQAQMRTRCARYGITFPEK